jgi:hypothetical protein
VEITSAILCDFAQVRDGLLFVSSGGITRVYHPEGAPLPQALGLHLAVTFEVGPDEINKVHEVKVKVTRQSTAGTLAQLTGAMQAAGPMELEKGEAATFPLVMNLGLIPLPALGAYDVQVSGDTTSSRMLTVYLKKPPPGMKLPSVPPVQGIAPQNPTTPPPGNRQQRRHPPKKDG